MMCVAAALLFAVGETSARMAVAHKDLIKSQSPIPLSMLHDYQQPDPANSANWVLKPGFVKTFAKVNATTRSGQAGNDVHLPAGARAAEPNEPSIRINQHGFRGPEIDRTQSRPRILTIGDSVTFGTIESEGYSRLLEHELHSRGLDAEVINAGVEGYSPKNVIYRLDQFKQLRLEIATVYLGWTPLFAETRQNAVNRVGVRLDSLRLASIGFSLVLQALQGPQVIKPDTTPKHPDPDALDVRRLSAFVPEFMPDVEAIVRELRSACTSVVP